MCARVPDVHLIHVSAAVANSGPLPTLTHPLCSYAQAPHTYQLKGAALEDALEKFGGNLPDLSHQRVWWMASDVEGASAAEADGGGGGGGPDPDSTDDASHFTTVAQAQSASSEASGTAREKLLNKKMKYVDRACVLLMRFSISLSVSLSLSPCACLCIVLLSLLAFA